MADRKVRFHPEAQRHLQDLYDYIASESGPDRAVLVIQPIESTCRSLGRIPELGRQAEHLGRGLRTLAVRRRAVIVYRIADAQVDILGVYYAGRDVERLVRGTDRRRRPE